MHYSAITAISTKGKNNNNYDGHFTIKTKIESIEKNEGERAVGTKKREYA